jgi:predicted nucleic acid-binding protein
MSPCVIDASAALACILEEQDHAARVEAVLSQYTMIAPTLWVLEVTNAVLNRERRRIITPAQADSFLAKIDQFQIDLIPNTPSSTALATLARRHQLSAYDAAYLDLALTRHLPLLTLDRNLIAAAQLIGLQLA